MQIIHSSSNHRYKGYHTQHFFWTNPRARRFSNVRLLILVALVGVGVGLLTWGLVLAQHAP